MARELQGYREIIGRLNEFFPGQEVLSTPDISRVIGKSDRTVRRWFPLVEGCTTKEIVARELCKRFGGLK